MDRPAGGELRFRAGGICYHRALSYCIVHTALSTLTTPIIPMRPKHAPVATKRGPAVATPPSPKQNHLLAALPETDYERLLPALELVPMPLGWAVYESGGRLGYLYFPTTSIVSLLYVMENGSSAEIAITGNDGLV